MKLSYLLLLRSLKSRPGRIVLSMFGIILGVASILAIGITNQTALQSITRLFEDTSGKANLVVISSESGSEGFREDTLRKILKFSGIVAAVPTQKAQTLLADESQPADLGFSFFGTNLGGLLLYGIDPIADPLVRDYTVEEGRFLSNNDDAYDVVLVQSFAEDKDIKLGGDVDILTPNGYKTLRAVGFISKDGVGQLNNGAFGVIPLKTMQELFNRSGDLDQVDVVVDPRLSDTKSLEQVKTSLEKYLGNEYAVIYPANQGKRMTQMLGSYQIGLNFLSGIALFVGAFLIYNTFSMTIVERTREFGMLRTVGMTRRQVSIQVLLEAVFLGLSGSLLGVLVGIVMSQGLTKMMEAFLNQPLGAIEIPLDVLVTGLVVGVIVTVAASFLPAWQAGKISPLEALRSRAKPKESWIIQRGWKSGLVLLLVSVFFLLVNPFPYDVQFRLGSVSIFTLFLGATLFIPGVVDVWEKYSRPLMEKVYGTVGQIGSRNVQRAKLRTALTVAALMVGVSMILIVRSMTGSFGGDLESWIDAYMGGDLYVTSSLPMDSEVGRRLESVEGVEAATPVRYLEVKWRKADGKDEDLTFMAIDPFSYTRVTSFVFSDSTLDPGRAVQTLADGDAVLISSVMADKSGLKEGDFIQLRTSSGIHDFLVAGVVVDFYNQGYVIEGSWNDMRRYFKEDKASTYLLKVSPGYNVTALQDQIDALYGRRYRLTIESNVVIKDQISDLLQQAFGMFDVLALIAVVVAALGVINTMTMNVMERTQEIGMLRGVGMTRWQVVRMVLAESGLMGIIGGVLGLLLGAALSKILFLAMMVMSGYELDFQIPLEAVLVGILVALVVSQIAALFPARRAARIEILEAIHYE